MVLSFLVPKDEYKVYIQFFVGIFMVALLLEPILELLMAQDASDLYRIFEELNRKIEEVSREFIFFEGKEK
jgi:hypothetical protein